MSMDLSGPAAFTAYVRDLKLADLLPIFAENGWDTFANFAFSVPTGSKDDYFEDKVAPVLLKLDTPVGKRMLPRVRQLYAQAYSVASESMKQFTIQEGASQKVHMVPAERADRVAKLKASISGFELKGPNNPSTELSDRMVTMLTRGFVKYVPWERCTSKEQEMLQEPEIKGLRITESGLVLQDVAPESSTDISGELLFDYALRRRALAADIAGLCSFQTMNSWHETLKNYVLKKPAQGHKRISWAQLKAADVALWMAVGQACEDGCKPKPDSTTGLTMFEEQFKMHMFADDVRQHLMFLQCPNGPQIAEPSSSERGRPESANNNTVNKLKHRIEQLEQQQRLTKQRLTNKGDGKGNTKGDGKGKGHRRDKIPIPSALRGLHVKTANNENLCFNFNLSSCPHAVAGQRCNRGWHVCARCLGNHNMNDQACPTR